MPATTFSPKQVAIALGVSESSVKRWVDSGKLPAAKTAGGHRKVALPSIARFLRETGHPVAQPELLGMVASGVARPLDEARDQLFEALVNGRESESRELVLGFYQQGESVPRLGDMLIGPVFRKIGEEWAAGRVQVYQERRSCEVMMAVLHELRRWLPEPEPRAPLGLVGTPLRDFAEVPVRLVELTLLAQGWRVTPVGSGLPLEEILDTTRAHSPLLLCLSATHLEHPEDFLRKYQALLIDPLRESHPAVQHALGGGAVERACGDRAPLGVRFTATLADLVAYLEELPAVA
ncbi:MAG: B12-binding domain-containing protein [Planctomycetota bacterium]